MMDCFTPIENDRFVVCGKIAIVFFFPLTTVTMAAENDFASKLNDNSDHSLNRVPVEVAINALQAQVKELQQLAAGGLSSSPLPGVPTPPPLF